ncbi:MAG: hypothetical protein AUK44_08670 [Porphyromonadaceae bacterium CG2_30_38_12]|nr:MAG: hypothetical protein AUK44_08670 [Porphyromonadaceae bacterium CG2_30_38_12]
MLISNLLHAQETKIDQYVKNWQIGDNLGTIDSLKIDSLAINFQNNNYMDNLSIANSFNGNLGTPIQSKIYANRPVSTDFIFSESYLPYLQNSQSIRFYNTKTPYSLLKYISGGSLHRESDNVGILFTANANPKTNFGAQLDYIYARGEYKNQAAKRFAGSFFGSYTGTHYIAHGVISTNNLSNVENGGIAETSYITNPPYGYTEAQNIPVRISVDAQSTYKQLEFFYNHQYRLGFEREIKKINDSVVTEFVPVTRFIHSLRYENLEKRYYEKTLEQNFYKNTYGSQTNDTAATQRLTNYVALNLAEEFNKWARFGLTAFAQNEIERYAFLKDSTLYSSSLSSTKIGGILSKEIGQKLTYRILGEISLLGYKTGDVLLSGNINTNLKVWKDTISLRAQVFSSTTEPSFFLQNYESNHFKWHNNFDKIFKTHIGGTFAIPTKSIQLEAAIENISKLIYFDSIANPTQFSGSVQLLSMNFQNVFNVGKFALENKVVYQESLNDVVLPLPRFSLYHNFYYHDVWFHVLSIQVGTDVRYHTSYFAPSYMPATGQFYNQRSMKVGNYPILNVYATIQLKRTRFFIEYYHLNKLFMNGTYYSMPYYPANPNIIKFGLTWSFYD